MNGKVSFDPVDQVIAAYAQGEMVIIADDDDRENEGDLAIATEKVTPEAIAFMAREGRGLICVSISRELGELLDLPLQVVNNNSPFRTAFAVSVDHKAVANCGLSATSRAFTLRKLIDPVSKAEDFVSPGNVFPLLANPAGVVARNGQTEASYDLARLAGLTPSGVICEILEPNGTMARRPSLEIFAKKHRLLMTSVADIQRFRIENESLLRQSAESLLETESGVYRVSVFRDDVSQKEHLALVYGDVSCEDAPLVRLHSECLTGDVFGSRRCDCGTQLGLSMEKIECEGAGVILYLRQEGRGIGLANKIKAYHLQDQGHDTVEANLQLGFEADERDFRIGAKILQLLGIRNVRLMTNNPRKVAALSEQGLQVQERVSLVGPPDELNQAYLEAKRDKLGHLL